MDEIILIRTAIKKKVAKAYLFWFSLGWLGAHRFYLGRVKSGIAQLLLFFIGLGANFFLLLLIIWWVLDAYFTYKIAEKEYGKLENFKEWDGSHPNLERIIKVTFNDPDSYKHIKTIYWDRGDLLILWTLFLMKNTEGGVEKILIRAKASLDGQILEIDNPIYMNRKYFE